MKRLETLIVSAYLVSLNFSAASASQALSAPIVAQSEAAPPIAGNVSLGVTVDEMQALVTGWSVKKDFLGKTVHDIDRYLLPIVGVIIIVSVLPVIKMWFAKK